MNQWHEYGNGRYYNEHYNDEIDLHDYVFSDTLY